MSGRGGWGLELELGWVGLGRAGKKAQRQGKGS